MRRRSDPQDNSDEANQGASPSLREKLIGLGESSVRKSYYPELQARLQQLQRFRAILDQSNDAIFLLDLREGFIVDFNRMVCDMAGCDEEHIPTKPFFEIFPEPRIRALIQNLSTGDESAHVTETEVHSTRGEITPVEISARNVSFGGVAYAVVVARDITERRRAEASLRRQRELDATLAELSGRLLQPISLGEIAGHVLDAAARLTESPMGFAATLEQDGARMTIKALSGTGNMWPESGQPLAFDQFGGLWGWVIRNGETLLSNDTSADPRSDGAPAWHLPVRRFLCVPALSGSRVTGIIALANADRDYAQEDLEAVQRLSTAFALAVQRKQSERDVLAAKEAAEAANQAKSEFLANMSHEIRTPLNGVLGMLQILQDNGLSEENKGYVNVALRSGTGLLALLEDLLSLSAIEAGQIVVREQTFCLPELLQTVIQVFRPQAEAKGIALHHTLDPELPRMLMGDPGRLRQILFNLVGNAVKFTTEGEVRLDVQSVETPGDDLRALFLVKDTGVGIPAPYLDKVWEVFTQVDGSSTRKHEGTGLGLHLVRRFVNALHGQACIESGPEGGTSVHVCLRFAPAKELSGDIVAAPGECFIPLHILLAEDEHVNSITVLRFLERLGHSADAVPNGREALEALKRKRYDVVLMDIQMPVMDGMEAARAIRASDEVLDPNVPILALTAHALEGDRERFLAAGMNEHLTKPLDMGTLKTMLQRFGRK
ncbi:MAG: response regulator [Desulfovibrio sp.]